jgi:hypothetical protein
MNDLLHASLEGFLLRARSPQEAPRYNSLCGRVFAGQTPLVEGSNTVRMPANGRNEQIL